MFAVPIFISVYIFLPVLCMHGGVCVGQFNGFSCRSQLKMATVRIQLIRYWNWKIYNMRKQIGSWNNQNKFIDDKFSLCWHNECRLFMFVKLFYNGNCRMYRQACAIVMYAASRCSIILNCLSSLFSISLNIATFSWIFDVKFIVRSVAVCISPDIQFELLFVRAMQKKHDHAEWQQFYGCSKEPNGDFH